MLLPLFEDQVYTDHDFRTDGFPPGRYEYCTFRACNLEEVDLADVSLVDCRLEGTVFERTNLKNADLRGALGYRIDPEENQIKGAHFSLDQVSGLLTKYQIKID